MHQTPTTAKDGTEDTGTPSIDPITDKWDGKGRAASQHAVFRPHW